MFDGIGVFDTEPLTDTTVLIPVNALELIVIAVVGSMIEVNKLQFWKADVPIEVTLEPIVIVVMVVLP